MRIKSQQLEIETLKIETFKKARILSEINEVNKQLELDQKNNLHNEEESIILMNGYIKVHKPVKINYFLHGNWNVDIGCATIDMKDIVSVKFFEGHGV